MPSNEWFAASEEHDCVQALDQILHNFQPHDLMLDLSELNNMFLFQLEDFWWHDPSCLVLYDPS
jgi:hypothetical protein